MRPASLSTQSMGRLRNGKPDVTALATREDAAGVGRASGDRRLRVVVHDYVGHPFQVHLSRELARRGMDVLHLSCDSFPGREPSRTPTTKAF
jgi:hypothetical protein